MVIIFVLKRKRQIKSEGLIPVCWVSNRNSMTLGRGV